MSAPRSFAFVLVLGLAGCQQAADDPSPPAGETNVGAATPSSAEPTPPTVEEPFVLEELPDAEGPDDAFSIKQVMQLAHENRLYRELLKEKVDPAVAERLGRLYESLSKQSPPKGDEESWRERTTALLESTRKVVAGDADGPGEFRRAVNCNSCHSRHRP